jgi:hypothetical protein
MAYLIVVSSLMSATLALLFLGDAWWNFATWMYIGIFVVFLGEWICMRIGIRDWWTDLAEDGQIAGNLDANDRGVSKRKNPPFAFVLMGSAALVSLGIFAVGAPNWSQGMRIGRFILFVGIFRTFLMTKDDQIINKSGIFVIVCGTIYTTLVHLH